MSGIPPRLLGPLPGSVRNLVVVLGDQLDDRSPALARFDRDRDAVLMMEVAEEATQVPSSLQRTVVFLSAMRHYAEGLARRGLAIRYVPLDEPANTGTFAGELTRAVQDLAPSRIQVIEPGEHRVARMVREWPERFSLPVEVLPSRQFLTTPMAFARWASRRRPPLVMEHFYRSERRRLGLLMDPRGRPEGGQWNYDRMNRASFGRRAPHVAPPLRFAPDAVTREVMRLVSRRFPGAPGRLGSFAWPVSRADAVRALQDFVAHRLPGFGRHQDAMWTGEPFLHHSLLSPALNLGLLDPPECVAAAVDAYRSGAADLPSVEAFVRQIIGWREFIRGVYWTEGPGYGERNSLGQTGRLPALYWTGETEMRCLREAIGQVLEYGYGHHIQRLMVTGNFALIAGVYPKALSDWYLGMDVDAVEWVTLPNTLGMVMHADARPGETRGVVGTKPYAASGRYLQRMSNYCRGCRYDPTRRTGPDACPFTVFYWDFLRRHRSALARHGRMQFALRSEATLAPAERRAIGREAERRRAHLGI